MSIEAIQWAIKQPINRSSAKFVLTILANCVRHDEKEFVAFASAAYLSEATAMDRKTVLAALQRLEAAGYITDTGDRRGKTRQVIVWRLTEPAREAGEEKVEENGTAAQPGQNPATHEEKMPGYQQPGAGMKPPTRPTRRASAKKPVAGGSTPAGTRIDADWVLPPEWRVWARTERPSWSDEDVTRISENFRDTWLNDTTAKASKPDWFAAWRLWVRNEHEPRKTVHNYSYSAAMTPEEYAKLGAKIRAEARQTGWRPPSWQRPDDVEDVDFKHTSGTVQSYPQAMPKSGYVPHSEQSRFSS